MVGVASRSEQEVIGSGRARKRQLHLGALTNKHMKEGYRSSMMHTGNNLECFLSNTRPGFERKQLWSSHSLLKLLPIIIFALKKKKQKLEQQGTDPVVSPKSYPSPPHTQFPWGICSDSCHSPSSLKSQSGLEAQSRASNVAAIPAGVASHSVLAAAFEAQFGTQRHPRPQQLHSFP